MHRDFFRIISQKPGIVKALCVDRNNPFDFACRKGSIYNQSN